LDPFCLALEQVGAGVRVDERVPINCPKATPLGYGYLVVALFYLITMIKK